MEKTPQEMAAEIKNTLVNLQTELDAVKNKETATPQEVKAAQDALQAFKQEVNSATKNFASSEDVDALKTSLKEAQDEIVAIKESNKTSSTNEAVSFKQAVRNAISENADRIKNFASTLSPGGKLEIQIKAPGTTTTANVVTGTVPADYVPSRATSYDPFLRNEIFVEQYFDQGNTDKATIEYVNELPGEGDAEIVAEGGLKPLIDADFDVAFSQAKKVAGRMKASHESLSDFPWLESAMTTTLKRKHDIARQNYMLGANGISGLATTFNEAILSGITVQSPQKYDAIVSLQTAISVQSEGVFNANVIFINNIDSLDMKLEKDADNNYLTPSFVSEDGTVVDGIRVVAKPTIPVGTFIIGDFNNVNVRNYWDYMVRFGLENDDFSRNLVTMIGESRFHIYVSDNEKRAIIAGNFADVITAITPV